MNKVWSHPFFFYIFVSNKQVSFHWIETHSTPQHLLLLHDYISGHNHIPSHSPWRWWLQCMPKQWSNLTWIKSKAEITD
jgi:hypothetical protein